MANCCMPDREFLWLDYAYCFWFLVTQSALHKGAHKKASHYYKHARHVSSRNSAQHRHCNYCKHVDSNT